MQIIALATDLLFATKIRSTAEALGTTVQIVRGPDSLRKALSDGADLLIFDLNADVPDPAGLIREVKARPQPPRIIAFCSHVQADLMADARTAGADQVLPRSRFTADLPALLQPAV